jgi:signal transduction histidine kinase
LFSYQKEKNAVLSIARNISYRKKVEEELNKKNLKIEIINEKLQVIGRLTTHDVRNKLTIAKTNTYLLRKQIGSNHQLNKYIDAIDSAIDSSNTLFEFSNLYQKIGNEELTDIDVTESFNQTAALFPNLSTIKIINECQGLTVKADSQLRQLFYNLIDNSLTHGEKVTQIRLYCSKEKNYIKLFYEDNGIGISKINKSKLFTEGFTDGKGSGLGLKLIKKMIETYGWEITEEGKATKGAKFLITIPNRDRQTNSN